MKLFIFAFQENFFDIQEALQAIHMRQEMLREQLAFAKSKGEETVGRNLQVGTKKAGSPTFLSLQAKRDSTDIRPSRRCLRQRELV